MRRTVEDPIDHKERRRWIAVRRLDRDEIFSSKEHCAPYVESSMKAILLPAGISFLLASILPAQTCREVVRDASGHVVQTVEHRKGIGGIAHSIIRDAAGRIIGTSTSQTGSGGTTRTLTGMPRDARPVQPSPTRAAADSRKRRIGTQAAVWRAARPLGPELREAAAPASATHQVARRVVRRQTVHRDS